MTGVGSVYGEALYSLAKEENRSQPILEQLTVLEAAFSQDPDFIRLLNSPTLTKVERCAILDDSFRGKVDPYLLNFMKILTEKGYMNYFTQCCKEYRLRYQSDHNILSVQAVTAVPLSREQTLKLSAKLEQLTGKTIDLRNKVDPAVLGGVRLDYDGKRLEDTLAHRMESIRELLRSSVL